MKQWSNRKRNATVLIVLSVLLLLCMFASFFIGRYAVSSPITVVRVLLSKVFPIQQTWTDAEAAIILNVRLPRILLACLVGLALAAAGVTYQGVFLNPMASPNVLGASQAAAFGAALAILLGLNRVKIGFFSCAGTTLFAFLAGLAAVALVYVVGQRAPGKGIVNLILAGIMVSSLFSAGTSFIKLIADTENQLPAITYWMMGSLSDAKLEQAGFLLLVIVAAGVPLMILRWRINLLCLGDEETRTLGVRPTVVRLFSVVCATLLTAGAISVSGMIGWVGLVIPHLSRKLVGNDNRILFPTTALFGALFLLVVDDVSRTLLVTEIPIGILTAFIGCPFFLYLIMRKEQAA